MGVWEQGGGSGPGAGHSPLTHLLSHRETAPWAPSAATHMRRGPRPPLSPDATSPQLNCAWEKSHGF